MTKGLSTDVFFRVDTNRQWRDYVTMPSITTDEFLVIDTETTGLDTANDQIVEFGASIFKSGALVNRGSVVVKPTIPIPDEAASVHKITDAVVADKPPFEAIADRISRRMDEAEFIVCYNGLRFDVPIIDAAFERAGLTWRVPVEKVLDALVPVNWHFRGHRPRTQSAIAESVFGIKPRGGNLHRADVDTEITGDLLVAMVRGGYVPDDLEQALVEQARLFPIIEDEYERLSVWLYRDRETGRFRIGAGKHCGTLLADVPRSYYNWLLSTDWLTDAARVAIEAAAAGRSQHEIQQTMDELLSLDRNTTNTTAGDDGHDDVDGWGG